MDFLSYKQIVNKLPKDLLVKELSIALVLIFFVSTTVQASTTIGANISTGGTLTATGLSTLGNASSTLFSAYGPAYFGATATSSFSSAGVLSLTSALTVSNGGTGASTFGQGWLHSSGGTGSLTSSTSPTVNYVTATSTTATSTFSGGLSAAYLNITGTSATSTFARGIDLAGGCFAINGTCLNNSASSTLLSDSNTWTGGNLFLASTTIGNGGQNGGLTIFGGATTTGNTYLAGNVGVGTTSPWGKVSVGNGVLTSPAFAVATGTNQTAFTIDSNGDATAYGRMLLPMGEVNFFNTTGTLVSIASQSNGSTNLVKVAPATSLTNDMGFDNGGADNGRLRYTGATTRVFHTAFTISMDGEGAGTNLYVFGIAKNGTVDSCKVIQSMAVSNDTQSTALHCMVTLATNDYLELYVGNLTDADDITAKTMNLFALGM